MHIQSADSTVSAQRFNAEYPLEEYILLFF